MKVVWWLQSFTVVALLLAAAGAAKPDPRHDHLFWFLDAQGQKQPVKSSADWDRRRANILQSMQDVMGPLPDRSSLPGLDLTIDETFQGVGYKRHTVSFANLFDERVTAYLYIPDGIKPGERRPGALALHPTGDEGKEIVDGRGPYLSNRAYGLELARRGYVVIAPDYPSFGQQKGYNFKTSRYA